MCSRVVVMYAGRIVEEADVHSLYADPKHPYTVGLIKSIPVIGKRVDRLESIQGNVPSLNNMPKGCKFAPRCNLSFERCEQEEPPVFEINKDGLVHKCRCWLVEEQAVEKEVPNV